MAFIFLQSDRYQEAANMLQPLCEQYFNEQWPLLHALLRVRLARCERELGEYENYAVSCLSLLTPHSRVTDEQRQFFLVSGK